MRYLLTEIIINLFVTFGRVVNRIVYTIVEPPNQCSTDEYITFREVVGNIYILLIRIIIISFPHTNTYEIS